MDPMDAYSQLVNPASGIMYPTTQVNSGKGIDNDMRFSG